MKTSAAEPAAPKLERPVLVQKYGGSSVANSDLIKNVARRVAAPYREGNAGVVVVPTSPDRREMDRLLPAAEIISTALLAMAVAELGVPSVSFTGQQAGMRTTA